MNHLQLAKLFKTTSWKTIGTDTQYAILEEANETIIIFAESNSQADWLTNFNFPKKPYKQMDITFMVHRGYLKEWKLFRDFFTDYLTGHALKPITIVGWSYGGAMATLAMEQIWFDFPFMRDSLKLVTFGSPRVIGFWNFGKVRERWENSTRYKNGFDLVTHVPFVWMGFRHVVKATRIGFWTMKHDISAYIKNLEEA